MRTAIAAVMLLAAAAPARADRRAFVNTYEYVTLTADELEVELYTDWNDKSVSVAADDKWTHQVELEYGITDRWDVSLYNVFSQAPGKSLAYDKLKLRTRYRLAERGEWPVDLLGYLEWHIPSDLSKGMALEAKAIVGKTFGKLITAVNLVVEQNLNFAGAPELAWRAGASYQLSPALQIGLEGLGDYELAAGTFAVTQKYHAGPVVSIATKRFWWGLGAYTGFTAASDQVRVRSVLGIFL